MNFSVYLNPQLEQKLKNHVKTAHQSRNAIVQAALEQYFKNQSNSQWSDAFLKFTGEADTIQFEAYRKDLSIENRDFLL